MNLPKDVEAKILATPGVRIRSSQPRPGAKGGPKVSEKDFLAAVTALAQARGWRVAHFRPGLTRSGKWRTAVQGDGKGFPDLVLVRRERLLWAELKADGGKLSPAQEDWLFALEVAGQDVWVWRPKDWQEIEEVLQ